MFVGILLHVPGVCPVVKAEGHPHLAIVMICTLHAGFPFITAEENFQCFGRPLELTCHYRYETTTKPVMWLMNGTPVENGGEEFTINDTERTLLYVIQNKTAETKTFQCCVELISRSCVCGEYYEVNTNGKLHVYN